MNKDKLRELLLLGEGNSVEFKTGCRLAAIGRQVCAFLNSSGGFVVCGLNDAGKVVGIGPQCDVFAIERKLNMSISPKTLVSVETYEFEGKMVLVVEAPAGKDVPYAFNNEVFIRDGERTIQADIETIREMVMRRQVEPERWERRFSVADLEADLDMDEVDYLVQAVNKTARIQFRNNDDPLMVLEDLALSKYGRLTNGGNVLFGKNPALLFPQARVRAVRFTSDKSDDIYKDMQSYEGPLVSVLEQVYAFILRNTPTISQFSKNTLARHDEPLYPSEAVREGLINAFAHRDYAEFSGGIAVHVYPRRLEIWNSGCFPEGVTAEKLATGHISVLRNPDISHVLYLRGLMEKLGRGSVMIQKSCLERKLPKPAWRSETGYGVTLTFFAGEVTGEVTGEVNEEVTGEVIRILQAMKGAMKRVEIQQALGLKHEEHFRKAYLLPALDAGFIEMTIPDKPKSRLQKYRVTPKGRKALKSNDLDLHE
ncbi:MAG: transcriptional regulator [Desulfobacterales bacterium S3730MH5]|nr:MAG: transcriptional regulator [Desulfobacterales bacterium S3730MH5]